MGNNQNYITAKARPADYHLSWLLAVIFLFFLTPAAEAQAGVEAQKAAQQRLKKTLNPATDRQELSFNEGVARVAFGRDVPEKCKPKPPTDAAKVVFVSGHQGSGISSVAVSTPDVVTGVVRLIIEPGTSKIYIMGSTYNSTIWKFEGATDRVEKFVTTSPEQRYTQNRNYSVGVSGLTQDVVEFLPPGCFHSFDSAMGSSTILKTARMAALVEHIPDVIAASYTLNSMKLPSGLNGLMPSRNLATQNIETKRAQAARIEAGEVAPKIFSNRIKPDPLSLYGYTIEGVIDIDVESVIAPTPARTYDVLPMQAGLYQLIETGHIEMRGSRDFKIIKPFSHFPAAIIGVDFVLGEGVAMPAERHDNFTVYLENSESCFGKMCGLGIIPADTNYPARERPETKFSIFYFAFSGLLLLICIGLIIFTLRFLRGVFRLLRRVFRLLFSQ